MSTPQSEFSQRSRDLLEAERGRDESLPGARADALLARVRTSVDARAKARRQSGVRRLTSRRLLFLAAAALLLIGGAALAAYRAASSARSGGSGPPVQAPGIGGRAASPAESAAPVPSSTGPETTAIPAVAVGDLPPVAPATPPSSPLAATRTLVDSEAGALEASDEAELITRARASLAAGATDAALQSLYLHERQFQHPKLSEQREILFVQTFAAAHRATEARQRFVRFKKAYANSPAIPALGRLVEGAE